MFDDDDDPLCGPSPCMHEISHSDICKRCCDPGNNDNSKNGNNDNSKNDNNDDRKPKVIKIMMIIVISIITIIMLTVC
jgi:hypothetical protein